jgi:hypothetical protein
MKSSQLYYMNLLVDLWKQLNCYQKSEYEKILRIFRQDDQTCLCLKQYIASTIFPRRRNSILQSQLHGYLASA